MKKKLLVLLPLLALVSACGPDTTEGDPKDPDPVGPVQPGGEGGEGGDPVNPVTDVTYTVTGMPSWVINDDAKVFAWVWGSGDTGSWVNCVLGETVDDVVSLTFTVASEKEGCLLVRCVAGTEAPDWAAYDNNTGRIYNQTEDITLTAGVYSVVCSTWKEYAGGEKPFVPPAEVVYSMTIGETPVVLGDIIPVVDEGNKTGYIVVEGTDVETGDAIVVKANEEEIYADPSDGNNVEGEHGAYTIMIGGTVDIYINIFDDGYNFWVTTPSPKVDENCYLMGGVGQEADWTDGTPLTIKYVDDDETKGIAAYILENHTFAADELFKFKVGAGGWTNNVVSGADLVTVEEPDGNLKIKDATKTYNVSVTPDGEISISIYVKTISKFYVTLGEEDVEMVASTYAKPEDIPSGYTQYELADKVALTKGQVISFKADEEAITVVPEENIRNNAKLVENAITVCSDATEANIYLKANSDGTYGLWVEGRVSETVTVYLKVNIWDVTDANESFWAYIWNDFNDEALPAKSVKMTAVEGHDGYYSVVLEKEFYQNVIFVRAPESMTEFNWESTWNQTVDLEISAFLGSDNCYSIGAWGQDTNVCSGAMSSFAA